MLGLWPVRFSCENKIILFGDVEMLVHLHFAHLLRMYERVKVYIKFQRIDHSNKH
ncbi:hypothetical protein GCM10007884_51630 [Methylobacterium brachythecii]|uniref:Uncharacterized protein n=1 Tax=Methylobacterium brachythecii TaxID=1176177 RepID=A0ABQ6DFU9_9HYPH|nr:hypothetical protein GCM10007884_51630 [Methylobacterium brachythecii]